MGGQSLEHTFRPKEPSSAMKEIASWRVVSELVRRYPERLTVLETHPGGGQYDMLTLIDRHRIHDLESPLEPFPGAFQFNRVGSVFINDGRQEIVWRGFWSEILAVEDPRSLIRRLSAAAGLPRIQRLPVHTPAVLVYRLIASFLSQTTLTRERWECRNGYVDTSGYGGGIAESYFAQFPGTHTRLDIREPGDVLGIPAYRFWFLVEGQEQVPRLALETATGIAWTEQGHEFVLENLYRKQPRILPLVYEVAGPLLP